MDELKKLKNYLDEHDYVSGWFNVFESNDQIVVYHKNHPNNIFWDVVCHRFSYGHEKGLLEIMAPFVDGDVEGWLTADDIIKKYLEVGNENGERKN